MPPCRSPPRGAPRPAPGALGLRPRPLPPHPRPGPLATAPRPPRRAVVVRCRPGRPDPDPALGRRQRAREQPEGTRRDRPMTIDPTLVALALAVAAATL